MSATGRGEDVRHLAVLADIQSFLLFLWADPKTDHRFDQVPEDERGSERVDRDRHDTFHLCDQQGHAAAVEQAVAGRGSGNLVHRKQSNAQRTKYAVAQVDWHRPDWI